MGGWGLGWGGEGGGGVGVGYPGGTGNFREIFRIMVGIRGFQNDIVNRQNKKSIDGLCEIDSTIM